MFADEIRRAVEAASRITLPAVTALLWRAYGDGKVTEAEAEALSGLIEARTISAPRRGENAGRPSILRPPDPGSANVGHAHISGLQTHTPQDRQSSPRRPGVGSRPRTDASMERRRRWAASGRLPPGIASKFTLAEQAVLALVAAETARRGDCRLAHEHVAALCGVSRSTVKNAMREARQLGIVTVEERPITGFRNLPNIVRIVSREWLAWLRLARKGCPSPAEGGGVKCATRTHTQASDPGKMGTTAPWQGLPGTGCRPRRQGLPGIAAPGRTGRAMR